MQKTLVVSRYNEDLKWLTGIIGWNIYIANKGDDDIAAEKVPNVGREAETYLSYIVKHYDNLSGVYCFIQGRPFDHLTDFLTHEEAINHINNISSCIEYTPLSTKTNISDLNGFPDHPGLDLQTYILKIELTAPNLLEFTPGAQFLVTGDIIKRRPKEFYNKLLQTVNNDIKPIEAYYLERLWKYIFSYEN